MNETTERQDDGGIVSAIVDGASDVIVQELDGDGQGTGMGEEAAGYILQDGQVITAGYLNKYAIKADARDGGDGADNTSQLEPETWDYQKDKVVEPPYSLSQLMGILEVNVYHYRCVKAKAADVAGLGWDLVEVENWEKMEGMSEGRHEENRQRLQAFFADCNPEMTFGEICDNTLVDYEGLGNGYWEVARNLKREPARIWHAPASTIRIRKGHLGFVQVRDQKKVNFQNYGEKWVQVGANGDGRWRPHFMSRKDGTLGKVRKLASAANEMIHLKNFTPRSAYYGLPDVIPAIGAVSGGVAARDFNLRFFSHNAVPDYAIIVKGAKLTPELKAMIADYFEREVVGSKRKTLLLSLPRLNAEIELKPLAVEIKDASFRLYRQDNRDEVIVAHGVPPARVGIVETGNIGAGSGLSQASTYKNGVIENRQERLETRIDKLLIQMGFGVYDWTFGFTDIDISDQSVVQEIVTAYVKAGLMSPNEGRARIHGLDPMEGGDHPFVVVGTELYFIEELDALFKQRMAEKSLSPAAFEQVVELQQLRADMGEHLDRIAAGLGLEDELGHALERGLPVSIDTDVNGGNGEIDSREAEQVGIFVEGEQEGGADSAVSE